MLVLVIVIDPVIVRVVAGTRGNTITTSITITSKEHEHDPYERLPITMKKFVLLVGIAAMVLGLGRASGEDVKVFATGKPSVKERAVLVNITTACGENGASLNNIKGTSLTVVGLKVADVKKLQGKEVELRGTIRDGKEFDVASVAEKKSAKEVSDSRAAPGAIGAVGRPRGAINAHDGTGAPSATGARGSLGAVNGGGSASGPRGPIGARGPTGGNARGAAGSALGAR